MVYSLWFTIREDLSRSTSAIYPRILHNAYMTLYSNQYARLWTALSTNVIFHKTYKSGAGLSEHKRDLLLVFLQTRSLMPGAAFSIAQRKVHVTLLLTILFKKNFSGYRILPGMP